MIERELRRTESFDILRHGIFIRRTGEGGHDAQKPNGKSWQGQLTTIDLHRFLRLAFNHKRRGAAGGFSASTLT